MEVSKTIELEKNDKTRDKVHIVTKGEFEDSRNVGYFLIFLFWSYLVKLAAFATDS